MLKNSKLSGILVQVNGKFVEDDPVGMINENLGQCVCGCVCVCARARACVSMLILLFFPFLTIVHKMDIDRKFTISSRFSSHNRCNLCHCH